MIKKANELWNWITNGDQSTDEMLLDLADRLGAIYDEGWQAGFDAGYRDAGGDMG